MVNKGQDIDQGYAWFVLAGCFVMYMLSVGSFKSYGVLYTEMQDYFGSGSGATAWIGSVCLFLLFALGPIANWLSLKFTFRQVGFLGGILTGVGYTLCMFIPRIEYMYVTFGVITGIGYSFAFTTSATIISFYFEKNRALANGITVSASGIGALTLSFLYRYLIEQYALKGTFLIVGAILFHICPAACVFTQPRSLVEAKRKSKTQVNNADDVGNSLLNEKDNGKIGGKKTKKSISGPDFRFSLFKKPLFTLYVVAFTLCMNGFCNNLILIPSHTKDLGYDKTRVSLGVSIMGGCEVFARIFFGWFADRKIIKRQYIFMFSMVVSSIFCFVAPQFKSFEFIAVYAAIVGIFPGSFWSLMPVLVIEAVGIENFAPAFGLLSLCMAFGAVFSQPLIGWLEDMTGNWSASFYLTGCLLLMAGIVIALGLVILKYFRDTDNNAGDLLENTPNPVSKTEHSKDSEQGDFTEMKVLLNINKELNSGPENENQKVSKPD